MEEPSVDVLENFRELDGIRWYSNSTPSSFNEAFNFQISDIITKFLVKYNHGPISGTAAAFASYYCGYHHISSRYSQSPGLNLKMVLPIAHVIGLRVT